MTKVAKSQFQSYIAYSGAAVLFLILLLIGYFFVQKRRSATVLAEKNKIVNQALKDKEILLKEVHHRVKNNMQVVSSLLQLKSINTEDAAAKTALLDSKKRIDSMQLVHQKMYQKGNYEQVDIVEYCCDIVVLLLDHIKTAADQFVVRGDEFTIHVEQAQALGFIIHELITNSIKYAWCKNQPKRIAINLTKQDDGIQMEYLDNGKGITGALNLETTKSFGMMMVNSLVTRQLLGKIELKNKGGFYANVKFNAR